MQQLFSLVRDRVEAAEFLGSEPQFAREAWAAETVRAQAIEMQLARLRQTNFSWADKQSIYFASLDLMQRMGLALTSESSLEHRCRVEEDFLEDFILLHISFFDLKAAEFKSKANIAGLIRPTNGYVVQDLIKHFVYFTREYFCSKYPSKMRLVKPQPPKKKEVVQPEPEKFSVQRFQQFLPSNMIAPHSIERDKAKLTGLLFKQLVERNTRTKCCIQRFLRRCVQKQDFTLKKNLSDHNLKAERSKSQQLIRKRPGINVREVQAAEAKNSTKQLRDSLDQTSKPGVIRKSNNLPMLIISRRDQDKELSTKRMILRRALQEQGQQRLPSISGREGESRSFGVG